MRQFIAASSYLSVQLPWLVDKMQNAEISEQMYNDIDAVGEIARFRGFLFPKLIASLIPSCYHQIANNIDQNDSVWRDMTLSVGRTIIGWLKRFIFKQEYTASHFLG